MTNPQNYASNAWSPCVGRFSGKMLDLQLLNSGVQSLRDTLNKRLSARMLALYSIKTSVTIGRNLRQDEM